jgi:hypothetical protein
VGFLSLSHDAIDTESRQGFAVPTLFLRQFLLLFLESSLRPLHCFSLSTLLSDRLLEKFQWSPKETPLGL